ncbi:MAG: 4'-phosphopantetheinyl transferase superfamily protein [Propionibacteriaceae bacterium]|jgi:4'-phosphopantetheinyl transferase|nr:4'-phosphopantetheinyl transferase superfamily protein [Propionibacteriaceae bacterium]
MGFVPGVGADLATQVADGLDEAEFPGLSWQTLPSPPTVVAWCRVLTAADAERGLARLSPSEQTLIGRLRQAEDRARSVTARLLLAAAVRALVGDPGRPVRLEERPHPLGRGKPRLNLDGWDASISHDEDAILVGVSAALIGVDVQSLASAARIRRLAAAFTAAEQSWLHAVPGDRRAVELWTAKEALLKALGSGFAVDTRAEAADVLRAPAAGLSIACFEPQAAATAAIALRAGYPAPWPPRFRHFG